MLRGGIYLAVIEVEVLDAGKMGKLKDLSDSEKGQIVISR